MAKRPDRPKASARPKEAAPKRRAGRPTKEELELFRAVMSDAEPLPKRKRAKAAAADAAPELPPKSRTPSPPPKLPKVATRIPPPPSAPKAAPLSVGVADGLDRRTMDKLRKGKMRPEAVIDLHGMTAADAHRALGGFLGSAYATGRRCVLVITGKGSLKEGGGVIRRELPTWLNASENRGRILGFAQARPGDGGGGAFYVLLKRRRT